MTTPECNLARATLKAAPLDTPILEENKPTKEFWAAICHYARCPTCRPMGLAEIRGQPMRCEEVIVAAVAGRDLLWTLTNSTCTTLGEVVAHEHIYGLHTIRESDGWVCPPNWGEGIEKACPGDVCRLVRRIWNSAPLSSQYDGDNEAAHGTEWAIEIAQKAGWDIGSLVQAAPTDKLGKFKQLLLPV